MIFMQEHFQTTEQLSASSVSTDYTTEVMDPLVHGFALAQKHESGTWIFMNPRDF